MCSCLVRPLRRSQGDINGKKGFNSLIFVEGEEKLSLQHRTLVIMGVQGEIKAAGIFRWKVGGEHFLRLERTKKRVGRVGAE